METDLHRIIYSRQPLTIDHVQYFVYQILRGMKYIHSANVIHRDLKPSNLLVNANCDLKICDFGLARGLESDQPGGLTEYVVTRWYRAPEIMLACHEYTKAIDVWSVGCIFAELLARQALFPGDDYIAQLRLISEKMGRPSESDLDFVTSERAKRFMLSLPMKKPVPMAELFPEHKNEREAHSLLRRLLDFHPRTRVTIDDALEHPFLSSLHNPEDEPTADFHFHFAFEEEDLSKERVQELIWEEIRELYPDIPETFPRLTPRGKLRNQMESKLSLADSDAKTSAHDSSAAADRKPSAQRSEEKDKKK
jgi:serine/threonine protein kinase